ncbi:TIGR02117 family protein [Hymenobacter sp. H14-R3]|uniref:TIGR02117 family protein n=1 Tax=Hymenobacter sp. H14-R3 TaxID=3046308 RepID=UPI0024BBC6C9|nr:TIGR02117 family protein [Hymenobacter sp. H14-R3]MDJ0365160.1 TIGR02117 family protein [Hymenobacter sp. H14-R3]
MLPVLRKTLKIVGYPAATLVGAVALYYGVAQVLSRIPVAAEPTTEAATVPFFIYSNGVHTDLVMPVKSSFIDWSQQLPYANTQAHDSTYEYVGVGWGDKGFYLDTPTWAQLKPSTAVRAGFWLSSTLMHATFYRASDLTSGPRCVPLHLTPAQYRRLIAYVEESFQRDAAGGFNWLPSHSYADHDAFYEANSRYSILNTCNTWTNRGLKECGQKASLWTPFDKGILYQYGR